VPVPEPVPELEPELELELEMEPAARGLADCRNRRRTRLA
jgi:hypothetical protein